MRSVVAAHRGPSQAQVLVSNATRESLRALPWCAINQLGYKNQSRGAESQSLLKMNSNMLIVLSLVAAALCAPQVQENVEEIEVFRHDWLEQMEYKEIPEGDEMPKRNNEQFVEEGLFYTMNEIIMNFRFFSSQS